MAGGLVVAIVFGWRSARILETRFVSRTVWDFYGFWVHGRAAWLGVDFYDGDALRPLLPWEPGAERLAELIVGGTGYPPFTSLLFAPFGALGYDAAFWAWSAFNLASLALAIGLAGRWLFRDRPHGWLVAAVIVLLLRASLYTVWFQQNSFLILLMLLLMLRSADRAGAGVWLALAVVVKPVSALFALHPLCVRHWRVLGGGLAAGLAIVAVTTILWGPQRFVDFAMRPPSGFLPLSVYAEPVAQSLGAEMTRRFGWHLDGTSPTGEPLYRVAVVVMLLATALVIGLRARSLAFPAGLDPTGLALGCVVAMALAVYPGTKQHYAVLLALPAWALWAARERLPLRPPIELPAAFIAATWALVAWRSGRAAWLAFMLWWVVLLALIWASSRAVRSSPAAREA